MKEKSKSTVSIISGTDGPTSVVMIRKIGQKSLRTRVKNHIYKCKRKRVEKQIVADAHTIEELVAYAIDKYHATECSKTQEKYVEQRKNHKEHLIMKHKPELLGDMKDIARPEVYDEDLIRELHRQIQIRSEMIAKIPDYEMPMDFHIYEIRIGDGCMEIEIDYMWGSFGLSYSGSKKVMKQLEKVARDLYSYYGVTEEDIRNKSERYSSLLATLSI